MNLAGASMLLLVLLSCMLQQSSSEMYSMKEFVSSTIDIDDAFQALNLNNIDSEKLTNMAASLADKFIRVHNNFYLPRNGPRNAKKILILIEENYFKTVCTQSIQWQSLIKGHG